MKKYFAEREKKCKFATDFIAEITKRYACLVCELGREEPKKSKTGMRVHTFCVGCFLILLFKASFSQIPAKK